MNSQKFGPIAWSLLHTLPRLLQTVSNDNTEVDEPWPESIIEAFVLLMYSKAMILPCSYCRQSYRIFIRAIDMRKWLQGPKRLQPVTSASVDQYLYTLHNMVNQKLNKPWHFDIQRAIPTNLLHNERALLTNLFEWLYILFLNYPQALLVRTSDSTNGVECCDEACRAASLTMLLKKQDSGNGPKQNGVSGTCSGAKSVMPKQCISESLARAIEHVKRQVNFAAYLPSANRQGVTLGAYVNKKLIGPVYNTMLSRQAKKEVDYYTFSKVCWYIVMLRNLLRMLLHSAEQHVLQKSTNVATARSPEAIRALKQLYQSFIEPNSMSSAAFDAQCRCFQNRETLEQCLLQHTGAWASSAEAIKHVHFARQLWDTKTESLAETRNRIENYRATGR